MVVVGDSCSLMYYTKMSVTISDVFFFQAEDGIRDLVRSRGLGDVYKRQARSCTMRRPRCCLTRTRSTARRSRPPRATSRWSCCLLYTSDAADERSSVDLGGRRIIKKKKNGRQRRAHMQKIRE